MLKFTADGHKQVFRAKEITKKAFDFWKNRSNELSQHVNGGIVDDDIKLGIYDEIEDFTVIGWELNNTTLTVDDTKENISFDLSEENLKKKKLFLKLKKNLLKIFVKRKKDIFSPHMKN
jgi:hypothetical protein